MYESLRSTASYLAQMCNEIVHSIDEEMLDAEYIGLCIEELEIGDCSIMSALHNALAESV